MRTEPFVAATRGRGVRLVRDGLVVAQVACALMLLIGAGLLLAMAFSGVALFLAAVGIYGVLAYMVAQRTKEIGIRVALGSGADRIFKLILREGLTILALGLALGIAGAYALRRFIENQLYEVQPMDPVVLVTVCGMLGLVALVACLIPAHRASRVDPIVALRRE